MTRPEIETAARTLLAVTPRQQIDVADLTSFAVNCIAATLATVGRKIVDSDADIMTALAYMVATVEGLEP